MAKVPRHFLVNESNLLMRQLEEATAAKNVGAIEFLFSECIVHRHVNLYTERQDTILRNALKVVLSNCVSDAAGAHAAMKLIDVSFATTYTLRSTLINCALEVAICESNHALLFNCIEHDNFEKFAFDGDLLVLAAKMGQVGMVGAILDSCDLRQHLDYDQHVMKALNAARDKGYEGVVTAIVGILRKSFKAFISSAGDDAVALLSMLPQSTPARIRLQECPNAPKKSRLKSFMDVDGRKERQS